eukprot:TRINITY_DN12253_c0_g1_i1.p1 TRINITY_DN12253_c0_g1~~TRINITY_DN12253_c0_g1_i1.p1  ORF type:complete len:602 (+),score=250.13 TRINITY_DN12253_c0_g1_i1:249-1808(+)
MTVKKRALLPVEALEKFCSETNAVVECKLKLSSRLVETHERGGDMQGFCLAAYEWFQEKYGMFCPGQCDKAQCKSTCNWLDDKKQHKLEGDEIKNVMMAAAEKQKDVIKGIEAKLTTLEDEKVAASRAIEQAVTNVGRAQKAVDENQKAVEDETSRMGDFRKKLEARESEESTAANTLQETKDALQDLEFKIAERKLDVKNMERQAQSITAKRDKALSKLDKFNADMKKAEADKRALVDLKDAEAEKAVEAATVAQKQAAVVQEAENKLRDAHQQYEAHKLYEKTFGEDGKPPEKMSKEFKAMVEQLKNEKKEEEKKYDETLRIQKKMEKAVDLAQAEIDNFKAGMDDLANTINNQKMQADGFDRDLKANQKKTGAYEEGPLATDMKTEEDTKARIAKLEKALQKAKLTTKFAGEAASEQELRLKKTQDKAVESKEHFNIAEVGKVNAEEAFNAKQEEVEGTTEDLVKAKDTMSNLGEELTKKVTEHDTTGRNLDRTKPEIVTQHGLGLLSLLITGEMH